jgi:predicted transcriptional regulator of viral defense system
MEFERLVEIVQDEPVFETGLLLAGDVDSNHIRRQLTRWTNAGKLYQLRRGLYALAPPYQKVKPHPFLIANKLVRGSYVSCQSALSFYGLIPEHVPTVVSVCSSRPGRRDTPLGTFLFRHIDRKYLGGYHSVDMGNGQQSLVAVAEKALLDLIYLTPKGDSVSYIQSLRLQNLVTLDAQSLARLVEFFDKPKMKRAEKSLAQVMKEDFEGEMEK